MIYARDTKVSKIDPPIQGSAEEVTCHVDIAGSFYGALAQPGSELEMVHTLTSHTVGGVSILVAYSMGAVEAPKAT